MENTQTNYCRQLVGTTYAGQKIIKIIKKGFDVYLLIYENFDINIEID